MSLKRFEMHLQDPAPGFRCFAAGDHSEKLGFLARVSNRIGKPASTRVVAGISKVGGAASAGLKSFASLHDGVVLYRDQKSEAAGVEFFKVSEWRSRTKEMRESLSEMGYEKDELPDWFHRGVVFAQIPQSGNYFAIEPKGPRAGRIYYCDHDDLRSKPIAPSFDKLLKMIADDPAGFLDRCGAYTRYSDGKSRTQWIPKQYVSDC